MENGEDLENELWTCRILSEEERMYPRLLVSAGVAWGGRKSLLCGAHAGTKVS